MSEKIEKEVVEEVVEEQPSDLKHIFMSKTVWVNILAIAAFTIQSKFGYVMDETTQVQILGVINLVLRSVTHEPVRWK
jgi:hypothetical protein